MVAKSYQSMTQIGEPYKSSGRMYVQVKNEQTGVTRQVRWYTEEEYAKMYGEKIDKPVSSFKSQKQILGFENGYVTIFKGDTYANLDWFKRSIARYCKWWGWYIVSTEAVPFDLPCGLEPIELKWEWVGEEDGLLKSEHLVKQAVDKLLYDEGHSEYQGNVGDRLDLVVTVVKTFKGENYWGNYTIHTFEDSLGNQYVWSTSSKSWEEGTARHIKGTVKEHKTYKNVKQTVLTRCQEVK